MEKKKKGLGIASLVLGIIGLVTTCIVVGIIPSVISWILGIITLVRKNTKKGVAIAGVTCSSIGIILFIIMFMVANSIDNDKELSDVQEPQNNIEEQQKAEDALKPEVQKSIKEKQDTIAVPPETIQKSDKNMVMVGESFKCRNLKITFDEYEDNFTDYEDKYGFYEPNNGNKYVKATFTYENIGKEGTEYISIYDFNCYAGGELMEQTYNFGDDFINANISSGRKKTFSVFYEIPINSDSVELEYVVQNLFSENDVIVLKCK